MRASTLSGIIRAMIELDVYDPEEIINRVNNLCNADLKCSEGISLFIASIDSKNRKLKFVNSGDCYPLLIRNNKVFYLRFADRAGGGLGCNKFFATNIDFSLEKKDLFVVLSGGITELKNSNGRELGLQGIIRFLEKNAGEPDIVIESLIKYADNYTGCAERRKDLSIVAFMV